jgi:uncharacterized RmlC-like cupin family protein
MMEQKKKTCQIIRPSKTFEGKQGLTYFEGIAAETVGSTGICMHMLALPPGIKAKTHYHEHHETAIYVIKGEAQMWYGDNLSEHMIVREGEFLYIPAGVPHCPANLSDSEVITVLARTDPNEQESVVPLPELDEIVEHQMRD